MEACRKSACQPHRKEVTKPQNRHDLRLGIKKLVDKLKSEKFLLYLYELAFDMVEHDF